MKGLKYIMLLAVLLTVGACQRSQEERSHVLKIYNWADYIDEDVFKKLIKEYKQKKEESKNSDNNSSSSSSNKGLGSARKSHIEDVDDDDDSPFAD